MLRPLAILLVAAGAAAGPSRADPVELMPNVTFERTVEFTPHGVVVLNVITAPQAGRSLPARPRACRRHDHRRAAGS